VSGKAGSVHAGEEVTWKGGERGGQCTQHSAASSAHEISVLIGAFLEGFRFGAARNINLWLISWVEGLGREVVGVSGYKGSSRGETW
jgi:hypothetical protein